MLHGSLWDPPDDVKDSVGSYVDEVGHKQGIVSDFIVFRFYIMLGFVLSAFDVENSQLSRSIAY